MPRIDEGTLPYSIPFAADSSAELTQSAGVGAAEPAPETPAAPAPPAHIGDSRIAALDGIRGFAMLVVYFTHCFYCDPTVPTLPWFQRLFIQNRSIDMFFTLSGYLITGILLDSKSSPNYFKNFYARRALRILPIYYASLILCHMNLKFMYPSGNFFYIKNEIWYWIYMFNNHWALNIHTLPTDPTTGHFWTLCVEEQFYLVWPLVVFFSSRWALGVICTGLAAGSLALRCHMIGKGFEPTAAVFFTFTHLDGIALGSLTAILMRIPSGRRMLGRLAGPVLAVTATMILLLVCIGSRDAMNDPFSIKYGILIYTLLSIACIAGVVARPGPGKIKWFFSFRLLTVLGKYSYGFYIFHILFRNWVVSVTDKVVKFKVFAWLDHLGGWRISDIILRFLIGITLVFLLALVSWNSFEKHFLRLKKRFE